jgi:uncharacterized protein (DUF488 family)
VKLATIGYQSTTVAAFLDALRGERIELLVDVRAVAMSRRPGFAKSSLKANLAGAGIEYLHLKQLGTPVTGRAAARSGHHDVMHKIFLKHLATDEAQGELEVLQEIIASGKRVCIMCFEARPEECHRTLVANALRERMKLSVTDLRPEIDE